MFNPAKGAKNIKNTFINYVTTSLEFPKDPNTGYSELGDAFRKELSNTVAKGPIIDLSYSFEKGKTINQLIDEGILSKEFRNLEKNKPAGYKINVPLDRQLYQHQEDSIRLIKKGKNAIITTGTGSGKTECFLYPLIDSLLEEKYNNSLDDGVRAILIYPMNALANDQMKRLRNILMYYPSITFGVYNGDTPEKKGETQNYIDLHADELYDELKNPIINEKITREDMVEHPPHILCTNYAMLEYMLLTPNRGAVFNNCKIKYIILDEAHTYSGATGMETSFLLRRLLARVNGEKEPQYILTSATLGKKNQSESKIVHFANNLTGANFEETDIVFSTRENQLSEKDYVRIDTKFFNELVDADIDDYPTIFGKYNQNYDSLKDDKENLYDVCSKTIYYQILRTNYLEPVELKKISSWFGISETDTVNFLHICTLAQKNNSSLVELRYHFFVRALEGAYSTVTPNDMRLFLDRKEEYDNKKVFEISICKNCGDIALVGHIGDGEKKGMSYLVSKEKSMYASMDANDSAYYFHFLKDNEINTNNDDIDYQEIDEDLENLDEDEADELAKKDAEDTKDTNDYYLCPTCGELSLINEGEPSCKHGEYIKVRAYDNNVKINRGKCLHCHNGFYNRFYIGTESATSVLAASLFEELPTKEVECKTPYNATFKATAGKQFLTFSDSRSEAAYFASYADQRFSTLIGKRLLVKVLKEQKDIINSGICTVDKLVYMLKGYFVDEKTFSENLLEYTTLPDFDSICEKKAWEIVVSELMISRRSNSLQSLGFLKFKYLGNNDSLIDSYQKQFLPNCTKDEVKVLLDELAMTFAYWGALKIPTLVNMNDDDKKKLFHTKQDKAITKSKTDLSSSYIGNWLPMSVGPDSTNFRKTYRYKICQTLFGEDDSSKMQIINFLGAYFDYLTNPSNPYGAKSVGNGKPEFLLETKNFGIELPSENMKQWWRCNKCGKITTLNIKNQCPVDKCDGTLNQSFNIENILKNNYYYEFYNNTKGYKKKMLIKEHTAQLSKKDASQYQIMFEKNNINALSCSTTFEMGVDVGELETVFLRDIPPSSANYAQRAGRAGRSKNSAAFVISYAKLSSHDFNYYERPNDMINGKILPPLFKLDNKKVLYRHIYSTLFGYFFNHNESHYEDENGVVRNIEYFVNSTIPVFLDFVINPSKDLLDYICKSFPNIPGLINGNKFNNEWLNDLIGNYELLEKTDDELFDETHPLAFSSNISNGRLINAVLDYRGNIYEYEKKIEEVENAKGKNYFKVCAAIQSKEDWYKSTKLIRFLVDANILPKYGFPIDTVELKIAGEESLNYKDRDNEGLRLGRDITQAISDYAPGSKIIANNRMYTARFISKYWKSNQKDFDTVYVTRCIRKDCKALNIALPLDDDINTPSVQNKKCVGCNADLSNASWNAAIRPSAGMITADNKGESVPLTRQKKIYHSDYYFVEEDAHASKIRLKIGNKMVTIISSKKDTIGVTSSYTEPFYVCNYCGFAYNVNEKIRKKNGALDKDVMKRLKNRPPSIKLSDSHNKPDGSECANKPSEGKGFLNKRLLYNSFNTDIIQIIFEGKQFDDNESISILYALLDAISTELTIERSDIAGVVSTDLRDDVSNKKFILFDNVPGGAGHVKRLLDDNYDNLRKVIDSAYYKTKDCACDENTSCYKCLRTYENQRDHENLSRGYVFKFLADYVGHTPVEYVENVIKVDGGQKFPYPSWNNILPIMSSSLSSKFINVINNNNIPLPSKLNVTLSINGNALDKKPFLYWDKNSVFVYLKSELDYVNSLDCLKDVNVFIADDNFDENKFISLLIGGQ